jgi:hypothetical protein
MTGSKVALTGQNLTKKGTNCLKQPKTAKNLFSVYLSKSFYSFDTKRSWLPCKFVCWSAFVVLLEKFTNRHTENSLSGCFVPFFRHILNY